MRRTAFFALPLAVTCLTACTRHHAAVIDREIEWATAMRAHDMDTLSDVMAPDFRLTLEEIPEYAMTADNGNPSAGLPRWMWLRNLGGMSFGPIEMAEVNTVEIDDDLVAVNMVMTLHEWTASDPERGEGDLSGTYELTDIWLNRDGEWRVITRYSRPRPDAVARTPDFVIDD